MKLHMGKMTSKELADWFGLKSKYYSNHKDKKLEELKRFAKFSIVYGGVIIEEIYEEEYSKQVADNYNKIKEKVPEVWPVGVPDTSKRVGLAIKKELALPLKDSTVIKYANQSKIELYGKPYMNNGNIGSCISLWCKTEGEGADQKISMFTDEELKIKDKLLKKYFGNTTEKQLLVEEMIASGEISKEEAWDVMREISGLNKDSFGIFKMELEAEIGSKTIRATILQNREEPLIECFNWGES